MHASIRNNYCHKEDELDSNSDDLHVESYSENIVYANLSTRRKNELQIKLMVINFALLKIDEKGIYDINKESIEEGKEINDSHHLSSYEDPFNLKSRIFRENLTCYQIIFSILNK